MNPWTGIHKCRYNIFYCFPYFVMLTHSSNKKCIKKGHNIIIFGSLIFVLNSYRAARHNWMNSKVCRSSENCGFCPWSSFCLAFSQNCLCSFLVTLSLFRVRWCSLLYSQVLLSSYRHRIKTGKTLIMLLTACAADSSACPCNMRTAAL